MDYPDVVSTKHLLINDIVNAKDFVKSGRYNLIGINLCIDPSSIMSSLINQGFDCNIPTLVYSECVLVYLNKKTSENLIELLVSNISSIIWMTYDMVYYIYTIEIFFKDQSIR